MANTTQDVDRIYDTSTAHDKVVFEINFKKYKKENNSNKFARVRFRYWRRSTKWLAGFLEKTKHGKLRIKFCNAGYTFYTLQVYANGTIASWAVDSSTPGSWEFHSEPHPGSWEFHSEPHTKHESRR